MVVIIVRGLSLLWIGRITSQKPNDNKSKYYLKDKSDLVMSD